MNNAGYPVICPYCKGHYFDTTDKYNTNVPSTGDMFVPAGDCKTNNWSTFSMDKGTKMGDLECPNCGGPLCTPPTWIVPVKLPSEDRQRHSDMVPCPVCGELVNTRGMHNHIKYKHPEYHDDNR